MHQCCRVAPCGMSATWTQIPRERDVCDLWEEFLKFLPDFIIAVNSTETFLPHWLALDLPHLVAVGTTIFSITCRCPSWVTRDGGGPQGAAYLMFSCVSFSSSCSMCSCNSPGRRRTWQMGQIGAWLSNKVAFFLPVRRRRREKALAHISCHHHHLCSALVPALAQD